MEKNGWKGLFRPENKKMRSNILLALLLGILLLAAGRSFSGSEGKTASPPQPAAKETAGRETERRMAEILSKVEGAGQVDVMLTYRQTEEKNIAHNETREESGETLRTEYTAILLEDGDGATEPLILTEISPVVEGVVIAAQGADSPAVAASLNQAAQALLDVPAHKVAVLKMK
ncbi:MAG: hypothetical protein J6A71_02595 [Anaerotignum sp.]|nr:hypothetical protein [Anaerotignum sp.]